MDFTRSVTRQVSKANFIPETCHSVSVSRLTPAMSADPFRIGWTGMRSRLRRRYTYRAVFIVAVHIYIYIFVGGIYRASPPHTGGLSPATQSTAELNPAELAGARRAKPWKRICLNRSKSGLRFETNSILSRGKKTTFERIML